MHLADSVPGQRRQPGAGADVEEVLSHSGPTIVPQVVLEAVADLEHPGLRVVGIGLDVERRPDGVLPPALPRRGGADQERVPVEAPEEPDVGVGAEDPVVVARGIGGLPVHGQDAQVRPDPDVAPDPKDRVVGGRRARRRPGQHREAAEREAAGASGQPEPDRDRDRSSRGIEPDPPTEEEEEVFVRGRRGAGLVAPGCVADVEDARVLQEELALLRKELAELGQVDLLLVGLDLGEVRIDGGVEREPRSDPGLEIDPGIHRLIEAGAARLPNGPGQTVRLDPEVPRPRAQIQTGQIARQRHPGEVVRPGHRTPKVDLVLPPDSAAEVHPPAMPLGRIEPERAERNRQLGRPAVGHDPGLDRPHRVPADVDLAPFVGHLPVGPGTLRIGDEDVPVPAVAEGVEQHHEGVLLPLVEILLDVVDDQPAGLAVVEIGGHVEGVRVERHPDLGRLGRRLPLVGLALHEAGDRHGPAPDRVVEHPVDPDRRIGPSGLHHRAAIGRGANGISRAGPEGQTQRQQNHERFVGLETSSPSPI